MRKLRAPSLAAVFTLLLYSPSPSVAQVFEESEDKTRITSRSTVRYTHVGGPGASQSFFENGVFAVEELDALVDRRIGEEWNVSLDSRLRLTNDRLMDQETLSLEGLNFNIRNDTHNLVLGDYFSVLSQYSMNQVLKGFGYQYNFKDTENFIRTSFGSFDSQWDFLYKDTPDEPINRIGGGVRAQVVEDIYRLGLNYAFVDDLENSRRGTEDSFGQHVGAVDWEARWPILLLRGEHAYSYTDKNVFGDGDDTTVGTANKLRLRTAIFKAPVTASVENVTPRFRSLAGSATADRRRYNLRVNRRFDKVWRASASYTLTHNDLPGSRAATRTTNTTYDIGLTRSRLFERRNLKVTVGLRRKTTKKRDVTQDRTVDRLKLSMSDRIAKVFRVRARYEVTLDANDVARTNARDDLFGLRLSSRHRLESGWTLRPKLSARRRESENITTLGDDVVTSYSAAITADKAGGYRLGADASYNDSDIFRGTDSQTIRLHAFAQLQPDWLKSATFKLDMSLNDYNFQTGDTDYDETIILFSVVWKM